VLDIPAAVEDNPVEAVEEDSLVEEGTDPEEEDILVEGTVLQQGEGTVQEDTAAAHRVGDECPGPLYSSIKISNKV